MMQAARKSARFRDDDDTDRAMKAWGEWVRTQHEGQGWGGAIDCENNRLARAPGTHSNPVLAEVLATAEDGQDLSQRVHRHILQCPRDWQHVAWLRFVGILRLETLKVRRAGTLMLSDQQRWRYSGAQTWERVADQLGWSLRTVEGIGSQIKRRIEQDLRRDMAMRSG